MAAFDLGPGIVNLGFGTDFVFSSVWSPDLGLFLAIADITTSSTQAAAYTSPDGYTWTRTTHTVTSSVVHRNVVWVPELSLFVKIADAINFGTPLGNAQTSPDGVTWTDRTVPTTPTSHSWRGLAWSPDLGMLCAAGSGGGTCRSTNGTSWTINTPITGTPNLTGMACGNGCFITMSANGDEIWRSTNGSTWTQVASFGDQTTWTRVIYSSELGLFLLIGAGAQNIMTSPDGITWTDRTFDDTHIYQHIEYANGLFVIGRRTAGTMYFHTSPDGITWTEMVVPTVSPAGTGTFSLHRNFLTWSPDLELLIFDGFETTDLKLVVVLVPGSGLTVTDVIPGEGGIAGGDVVEVVGDGFEAGIEVLFDQLYGLDVVVNSPTSITVTTPPHAEGFVTVTVTNPDGAFDEGPALFEYTDADSPFGAPFITSVTPDEGPMSGGTAVTIIGGGFEQGAVVLFGDSPATSVVVVNDTQITCVTPAHPVGPVDVQVVT